MAFVLPFLPYIAAAGAVVTAVGAYQQGQAAKAAGEYNAKMADQNAQFIMQQTQLAAKQADRNTVLRLGSIRAAQGASGGTMSGSALDVIGDVASQSELEKQQILVEGEQRARGYGNTATLDRMGATNSARAGTSAAAGALLSGAVQTGSLIRNG